MKAKITMMMGPAEVHEFKEGSGRITVQKCSGTVDGVEYGEMLLKAFNGDAARMVANTELTVKPDDRRRDGDPPSFVLVSKRPSGGARMASGGGGLTPGQFCLQQRGMLAVAALTQAVEMVKGTDEKALPLADKMFDWLRNKSQIEIEETHVKGGA